MKKVRYLTNANIKKQFDLSMQDGKINDELAKMFMLLTKRFATRPQFNGYSYNDEMQATALLHLCQYWDKFNPDKSDNYFAYYTQIIKNAFITVLNKERNVQDIRDQERMFANAPTSPKFDFKHK